MDKINGLSQYIVSKKPIFKVQDTVKFQFPETLYTVEIKENPDPLINKIVHDKKHLLELFEAKQKTVQNSSVSKIVKFNYITKLELALKIEQNPKDKQHIIAEICSICRCELYDDLNKLTINDVVDNLKQTTENDVMKLDRCDGHYFHLACIENYVKSQPSSGFIKCPMCCFIYGVFKGDMPDGEMRWSVESSIHCAGYGKCGTIVISYQFPNGKTPDGRRYSGTSRQAYLPNNPEGNEVFELLRKAFDRKLTFTVGTSVTTGRTDTVVWNGIHHKTNVVGGATNFGYPDPTYFNRVKEELAAKGIV